MKESSFFSITNFENFTSIKINKNTFYKNDNFEVITYKYSKFHRKGNFQYWYGIAFKTLEEYNFQKLNYLGLIIGDSGIVKIPFEIIKDYLIDADITDRGNGTQHYHLRLKYDSEDNLVLFNKKKDFNISEYLIYDEYILTNDLENQTLKAILKKAKKFIPFDSSYYEKRGNNKVRRESYAQKMRIAKIENYTCQVCNFHQSYIKDNKTYYIFNIDHIIEKSSGGSERIDNLWVLCPNCHAKKTKGIIKIDMSQKKVFENDNEITIVDNHLFIH